MISPRNTVLYLIDTSSIIQANKDYPPTVFPRMWDFLTQNIKGNAGGSARILLLKCVLEELQKKTDDLQSWSLALKDYCVNEAIDEQFILSLSFVTNGTAESFRNAGLNTDLYDKKKNAFNDFCRGADIQLIAYAKEYGCKIITNETRMENPNNSWRVKIPNVGDLYGIECLRLIEMLKKENVCFNK